jgi:hypothetical protein
MAQHMVALASEMAGFLGVESARGANGTWNYRLLLGVRKGDSRLEGTFRTQSCARS